METRGKRRPSSLLLAHIAKRCKSNGNGRGCTNKSCTAEVETAMDSSNFEESRTPARFMFYEQGEWHDFAQDTCTGLLAAFTARCSSVEFCLHGSRYRLSFIRMVQVNLTTGFCRSIAWIDVSGRMFSPSRCIEGYDMRCRKLNHGSISPDMMSIAALPHEDVSSDLTCQQSSVDEDASQQSLKSTMVHVYQSVASAFPGHDRDDKGMPSDSSDVFSTSETSSSASDDVTSSVHETSGLACDLRASQNFPLLQDKLVTLLETETEFAEVKTRFMAGLNILANETTVTSISKDCHRSPIGCGRRKAFEQQEELTKSVRGDANVRYAWYGTSKKGVSSILLHGFGQPKTPKDGGLFGAGIYLAPENYANLSAVYSDVDENGEQHVVLCRVIMGFMEQVSRGSVQFHPSSEDFDGGVDDLHNPRQYIVWSTHMNTHILPEYVVSFKLTAPWQGIFAGMRCKRKVNGKPSQFGGRYTQPAKMRGEHCGESAPKCSHILPRSPRMSVEALFFLLKSNLSAEAMDNLRQRHLDFKGGSLSSSEFIRNVRVIAGEDLFNRSIKAMQTQVLGAVMLQNVLASQGCQIANNNRVA